MLEEELEELEVLEVEEEPVLLPLGKTGDDDPPPPPPPQALKRQIKNKQLRYLIDLIKISHLLHKLLHL